MGGGGYVTAVSLPKDELIQLISELEKQMQAAAQGMEFEKAAVLRDQIIELRQTLQSKETNTDKDLPEWERLRKQDTKAAYQV